MTQRCPVPNFGLKRHNGSGKAMVIRPQATPIVTTLDVSVFFYEVKSLRQFGVVLLLLVSFVAPAMACMASDVGMTAEERACCRMMNNDCGQMEMSASHDCCKKTSGTLHDTALRSDSIPFQQLVAVPVWVSSLDLFPPQDITNGWFQRPEHSPPKPPPSIISALRV